MRRRSNYDPAMSPGMAIYLLSCAAVIAGCFVYALIRLVVFA